MSYRPDVDEDIYQHLRAVAGAIHAERHGGRHSISPTGLLHEAWLKLGRSAAQYNDRAHFMAVAARAMRQILVDRARARLAKKRGAGAEHLSLTGVGDDESFDVLMLDDGLKKLAQVNERAAEVVLLRTFGGMTVEEVAQALGLSAGTVKRDWRFGRAWLNAHMG